MILRISKKHHLTNERKLGKCQRCDNAITLSMYNGVFVYLRVMKHADSKHGNRKYCVICAQKKFKYHTQLDQYVSLLSKC